MKKMQKQKKYKKRQFSIKRHTTLQFQKIERAVKSMTQKFLKSEYRRQQDLGVRGNSLIGKMLKAKEIYVKTQLKEYEKQINFLEKFRNVDIKKYEKRELVYLASFLNLELNSTGTGVQYFTTFNFKILEELENRGINIYNPHKLMNFTRGLAPSQIAEFAKYMRDTYQIDDFFYQVWNEETGVSNSELFKLLNEFIEHKNITNKNIKQMKLLMLFRDDII